MLVNDERMKYLLMDSNKNERVTNVSIRSTIYFPPMYSKGNLKYWLAFPWSRSSALTCVIIFIKHAFLLQAKYIIRFFFLNMHKNRTKDTYILFINMSMKV